MTPQQNHIQLSANEEPLFHFHGFKVGNVGFVIDSSHFCEIIEEYHQCRIPHMPYWLVGVTNIRGSIIPIIQIHRFLGFHFNETATNKKPRIMVIDAAKNGFACVIESLPQKIAFTKEQAVDQSSAIPEIILPFLQHIFFQERLWLQVNFRMLIQNRLNGELFH